MYCQLNILKCACLEGIARMTITRDMWGCFSYLMYHILLLGHITMWLSQVYINAVLQPLFFMFVIVSILSPPPVSGGFHVCSHPLTSFVILSPQLSVCSLVCFHTNTLTQNAHTLKSLGRLCTVSLTGRIRRGGCAWL